MATGTKPEEDATPEVEAPTVEPAKRPGYNQETGEFIL